MNFAASMDWLTGPILDKELRVSSRRRRNYWLRFVYIALLMIPLAVVFQESVRSSTRQANTVAQLCASPGCNVGLESAPFVLFIADALAVGADRDEPGQELG